MFQELLAPTLKLFNNNEYPEFDEDERLTITQKDSPMFRFSYQ